MWSGADKIFQIILIKSRNIGITLHNISYFRGAAIVPWIRPSLHRAATGSTPKHTIYAFINLNLNCYRLKRRK